MGIWCLFPNEDLFLTDNKHLFMDILCLFSNEDLFLMNNKYCLSLSYTDAKWSILQLVS